MNTKIPFDTPFSGLSPEYTDKYLRLEQKHHEACDVISKNMTPLIKKFSEHMNLSGSNQMQIVSKSAEQCLNYLVLNMPMPSIITPDEILLRAADEFNSMVERFLVLYEKICCSHRKNFDNYCNPIIQALLDVVYARRQFYQEMELNCTEDCDCHFFPDDDDDPKIHLLTCPKCGKWMPIDESYINSEIECPHCHAVRTVEELESLTFNAGDVVHMYCKTCNSHVYIHCDINSDISNFEFIDSLDIECPTCGIPLNHRSVVLEHSDECHCHNCRSNESCNGNNKEKHLDDIYVLICPDCKKYIYTTDESFGMNATIQCFSCGKDYDVDELVMGNDDACAFTALKCQECHATVHVKIDDAGDFELACPICTERLTAQNVSTESTSQTEPRYKCNCDLDCSLCAPKVQNCMTCNHHVRIDKSDASQT